MLTIVPVDDEAAPEDEAAADPAWHRHEPKVIWPCILNARKTGMNEPGLQTF